MRKLLLLSSVVIAMSLPWNAHALTTNEDALSYVAMPLAVSDVCDVRGVQTDQVGLLVTQLNRANLSPDAFVDVFRYVPVALTLHSGQRADFVPWVQSEIDQGIVGDELVTAMERRLSTYGNVIRVPTTTRHRTYAHAYRTVIDEENYVPVRVVHYSEQALLDPFALIDMPLAVADVVDVGVPVARVGGLVAQLNLGSVAPLQEVEILRYSPPALLAVESGQPDFVNYVYDQRVSGLSGYDLVRVVDRQLPIYGVTPQIDLAAPLYASQNAYVPSVVTNYVAPVDPAFVPPVVRARVASAYAAGTFVPQQAPAVAAAPSPEVNRLLERNGSAVVTNPGQAQRELAAQLKHGGRGHRVAPPAPAAFAPQAAPASIAPQPQIAHGHGHAHIRGEMHAARAAAPAMRAVVAPRRIARPEAMHPQHGRGRIMVQPHVMQPHVMQPHVMAPRAPRGNGGQGHVHAGGPPPGVVLSQPQPHGQGHGQGKKGKG